MKEIEHDAFMEISESSLDIGFSATNMLEARTTDGHVFLIKSIEADEITGNLTFFSIFKDNGNVPLAKMVIDRSAVRILKEIARI